MEAGFFLKLSENTGDGFAYVVLPAKDIKDILRWHNPVTLVRCVVRSRDSYSSCVPCCIKEFDSFKLLTETGEELFSDEELDPDHHKDEIMENTLVTEEAAINASSLMQSSFQSQSSQSLTALDVDISTILEE